MHRINWPPRRHQQQIQVAICGAITDGARSTVMMVMGINKRAGILSPRHFDYKKHWQSVRVNANKQANAC